MTWTWGKGRPWSTTVAIEIAEAPGVDPEVEPPRVEVGATLTFEVRLLDDQGAPIEAHDQASVELSVQQGAGSPRVEMLTSEEPGRFTFEPLSGDESVIITVELPEESLLRPDMSVQGSSRFIDVIPRELESISVRPPQRTLILAASELPKGGVAIPSPDRRESVFGRSPLGQEMAS